MTALSTTLLILASACSEKTFTAAEGSNLPLCAQGRTEVKCEPCQSGEACSSRYDYEVNAQGQISDVLFVVDNSGSMYEDQVELGTKFPNFLSSLAALDYRIAITTTDVRTAENIRLNTNRPGPTNGNGAFQDGRLISFANGAPYLSGSLSTSVEQSYFLDAITRDETRLCEVRNNGHHYNADACPSGDERGILAAAMTVENNPSDFIRPTGHLAVVFLSDEDEGSDGVFVDNREVPVNFVNNFRSRYPNKSLKAHSIIIRPNSTEGQTCFNEQSQSLLAGQFGTAYDELSRITNGNVGSICADDYTSQLRDIGASVSQVREVLPCRPINNQIGVSFSPQPPYTVNHTYSSFQNEVLFSRALPQGTKIRFQFTCSQ